MVRIENCLTKTKWIEIILLSTVDILFFRSENGKENINQSSNCTWWGFNTSGFFRARGTRSVPWLLFRLRFRVRFGRSIGLPCWSTGWGHRAWCRISQHCFVALGLQTYTIPRTSPEQAWQNVRGLLLQPPTMHCPWNFPEFPPLLKVWFLASSGSIGIDCNSEIKLMYSHNHLHTSTDDYGQNFQQRILLWWAILQK